VRVEVEEADGGVIVHNYGHGGSGYTLSWGCAEDTVALVRAALA
jgi:D-amino-acid oxidase